jgi:hypothetical protein
LKKKKFNISQAIIAGASECVNRHICLSKPGTLCGIKEHEEARVLFVKKHSHRNCPFAISIGMNCICTCPVRVEIFRKYRV